VLTKRRLKQLKTQLDGLDYEGRFEAVRALGESDDAQTIEPLLDALGNFDPMGAASKLNAAIALALAEMGNTSLPRLIEALHQHNRKNQYDNWRRYWIAIALGEMGNRKGSVALSRCLLDHDPLIVVGAARAMARLGDVGALDSLGHKLFNVKEADTTLWDAITQAIDELIEPSVIRCEELTERGVRCKGDVLPDGRYCADHAAGKYYTSRYDSDALRTRVMEASRKYIPTSQRRGIQSGDILPFDRLYYGDQFTKDGALWRKVPYEPGREGAPPFNAMSDEQRLEIRGEEMVAFVKDAGKLWPHYVTEAE
jgi:hypothetical protein